ncbi:MAG: hypothetical protein SFX73_18925, partial [Kofleriaceae bacterium]|nr:hypothetical protein [Kofleriaceae bacterium]
QAAMTPPPLPRTTTSQAAITPPVLPRTTTSQAAMTPPPLPRTTTSQAAITPPVLPRTTTSQAAITPPESLPLEAFSPPPAPPKAWAAMAAFSPPPTPSRAEMLLPPAPGDARRSMSEVAVHLPPVRGKTHADESAPAASTAAAALEPALVAPPVDQAKVDMTSHQPWFEDSRPSARFPLAAGSAPSGAEIRIGTSAISRPPSLGRLVGMLVLPTILLAVIGIFVGGYLAFDGQGGKKRMTAASPPAAKPTEAAPSVALAAPAVDLAAAPTPTVPSEPAVASEPQATEPAKAESPATEPAKHEPAEHDPAKAESPTAELAVTPPNVATMPQTPSMVPTNLAKEAPTPSPSIAAKTFIDVRIDSKPSGATVTLVDRGKSTFLGTTPIKTSVDPSRSYEVVFEHNGTITREPLDPRTTSRLEIALAENKVAETPKAKPEKKLAVAAVAKTEAPKAKAESKPQPKPAAKIAPNAESKVETKTKAATPTTVGKSEKAVSAPATAHAGTGILMVSSKPPCEIFVDGKATGFMTPQRSISLASGSHTITLVSADKKHKKTVAVDIVANKSTKLIQNLMAE